MARTILLDTNVVGLLTGPGPKPGKPDQQTPCRQWFNLRLADADLVFPDVVDYEILRELIRAGSTAQLARLNALLTLARPMPITPEACIKAAEFWALLRQGGLPTAHPEALDGDAVLAGVAATVDGEGDAVIVTTTNARHLGRFPGIVAEAWEAID